MGLSSANAAVTVKPPRAELGESGDADSVPSLRAMEVARAPESEPVCDGDNSFSAPVDESPVAPTTERATQPSIRKQRQARSRSFGWVLVAAAAATVALALRAQGVAPDPMRQDSVPAAASPVSAMTPAIERPSTSAARVADAPSTPSRDADVEPKVVPVVAPTSKPPSAGSGEQRYDAQRLGFALHWARTHAEACHRGGRAVGTVRLEITFSPDGRVSDLVLSGEPVAGTPVAGCVESYYRAMLMPAYEGEPFTISEQLTLR